MKQESHGLSRVECQNIPVMNEKKQITVAFQGEFGANSEDAVRAVYPEGRPVPCRTLRDVFAAVAGGATDYAVVPVENSQAGSINDTYDLLLDSHDRLYITAEYNLRVHHMLLGLTDQRLETVHTVTSHPQALAQSERYLSALGVKIEPAYDTAGAARRIATESLQDVAAVASRAAAATYGLAILAENIETSDDNYTRFLALGREKAASPRTKTSLVMSTRNTPGSLYHALGPFAARGVNMIKLESRPSRARPWEYIFYLDVEGDAEEEPLRSALGALHGLTPMLTILGSYSTLT
jgi:prephenate dehydratase